MNQRPMSYAILTVSFALFAACAHTLARRPSAEGPTASADGSGASEPSLRNELMQSVPELKTALFSYDSSNLLPQARAILTENSMWLKDHADVRVQVAGHCDQRGTVEYNLALGQRRAKAVRDYYILLGVPGDRIATISYGKERPVCLAANETCWQRNRRAETLAASRAVSGVSRNP